MEFKSFTPRVDKSRRLVLTRFYAGVKDSNSFCYQIHRITKSGTVDKRFKTLYSFATDDFTKVKEFRHSQDGRPVKVYKTPFKSVFGVKEKNDPIQVWRKVEL